MKTKVSYNHSDLFNKYLDECKGEVKSKSSEGYYHVDVVAEAYTKGFSDGKKSGEKDFIKNIISNEIEKFTQRANQIYILSKNVISYLNTKKYNISSLHINLTLGRPSVIISVNNDQLNDDTFIESAYSKIFENKNIYLKLFNENLDIGLVSSDSLDGNLLEEDGFGYIEKYQSVSKRKIHGERNKKLSEELFEGKVYFDWVVTTAFYSAIHLVEDKILPCDIDSNNCKNINDVKKAYRMNGRHSARERLVRDKMTLSTAIKYKWLDDKSRYSRYTTFKVTLSEAEKAKQFLSDIQKECNNS